MEDKLGVGKGHCASEWGGRETGKFLFTDEEVLALISAERERCAKLCDAQFWIVNRARGGDAAVAAGECAAAIRGANAEITGG